MKRPLSPEDRARLGAMAERAEQEVRARRQAAECWYEGTSEHTKEMRIAAAREADALALRRALALLTEGI